MAMNFTKKDARSLKKWYKHLPARHVDLVGDYAGNELFLIHGESILLHCFENDDIDFDSGFQLLHAIHAIEAFLLGLVQRKCNFHVVFFDSQELLCIPEHSEPQNSHKYTLARAVVIRHLQAHLPKSHPQIQISVYESYHVPAFKDYLSKSGIYFVMCHDGASNLSAQALPSAAKETDAVVNDVKKPGDDEGESDYDSEYGASDIDSDEETNRDDEAEAATTSSGMQNGRRTLFRAMLFWFARHGHYLALINGLQWQDTKVFTMVLEGTRHSKHNIEESLAWLLADDRSRMFDGEEKLDTLNPLNLITSSESVALLVYTVRATLSTGQISPQMAHALIIHSAILHLAPLAWRRLEISDTENLDNQAFQSFTDQARRILRSPSWVLTLNKNIVTDVADFLDGRILNEVNKRLRHSDGFGPPSEKLITAVNDILTAITSNEGPALEKPFSSVTLQEKSKSGKSMPKKKAKEAKPTTLLPFVSSVFDSHLASVHVVVDETGGDQVSNARARVFRDLTHWHNTKPIVQKTLSEKDKQRALRSNQFFMREMTQYAASLTNAVGKVLEPETIITGQETKLVAPVTSLKAAKLVAENLAATAKKNEKKFLESWKLQIKEFDQVLNLEKKYLRAKAFLDGLIGEKKAFLEAEVEVYLLNILLQIWSAACREEKQSSMPQIPAMIFDHINRLTLSTSRTKTIHDKLELTSQSMGLPYVGKDPSINVDRPLSFPFFLAKSPDRTLKVLNSSREFQLLHCGPYFDRSIGSSDDDRVRFKPDAWQRNVLDVLDQNKSVFVVAPTSAGKTFISFYAMKQILKADDDGVLVYVAPTKALVNQIAAELQANFSKKFKHGGKSVWAIHTRDYRVNNTTGCQVLVTLPHILQIMLMSPENARSWAPRVRRIIFDEIHSIGQAEDGIVWEQLLLLAPCPIIALSATVGNPGSFNDWLVSTQKSLGFDMVMIQHPHRYSDLRKYIYQPPSTFRFKPFVVQETIGLPSLDDHKEFAHLHPVASLLNDTRGIPEDLHLEPNDCLLLWTTLKKHSTTAYSVDPKLDPATALPQVIRKIDIINWEAALKAVLKEWMMHTESPFKVVVAELSKSIESTFLTGPHAAYKLSYRPVEQLSKNSVGNKEQNGKTTSTSEHVAAKEKDVTTVVSSDLLSTTLPLLSELNERNALPAILFNYDRTMCERICKKLMEQLIEEEKNWKATSPQWQEKLKAWEKWKLLEAKKPKKAAAKGKKKGGKGNDDDDNDDEKGSKADNERDNAEGELSPFTNFKPDEPQDGFHFANNKRLQRAEFDDILWKLKRRHIAEWLCDALLRGIGVHHAGMNRAYRQAVETLFRRGFLRVVIATGTLALGINMPCRTVVFSGDSIYLTALNYRQAAGRAGRRGFDLLGNVVFQNIPTEKICRLVSSRLPDLNGHFPITTSLVLRLFILLSESKNSRYAERAIESLLAQSRLYLGGPSFKEQILHHLRFSIEYLRRQHLLSRNGTPLNFAGCVSHLYFTEQSSFAFHALLKDGYFHSLCKNMNKKSEPRILDTLMLVMSHLFGRRPCRQVDQEYRKKIYRSSSMIFLPELPAAAKKILHEHNDETLKIFTAYVKTFAAQHLPSDDNKLPLSGIVMGGEASPEAVSSLNFLPPTLIRSSFAALSGHGDSFKSISELCRSARDGVFLEESVIPHITLYPDEAKTPLNAYLYDYLRHGDVRALAEDNGVRRGDVWFLLNDFSLVLATIVTSFRNYLNLSDLADSDVLDAAGGGDMHEVEEDDRLAEEAEKAEAATNAPKMGALPQTKNFPTRGKEQVAAPVQKKKKKVIDSWDDEDIASSSSEDESATLTGGQSTPATSMGPAWEEDSGESLLNVLKAFEKLKAAFDEKFKAMWA